MYLNRGHTRNLLRENSNKIEGTEINDKKVVAKEQLNTQVQSTQKFKLTLIPSTTNLKNTKMILDARTDGLKRKGTKT